jgi:hypothetical protein
MSERMQWQSFKVEGGQVLDKVKELIHEGNVRRIIIKQGDRTLLAPWLAAVGALAAFVTDCTIEVERTEAPAMTMSPPKVTEVTPPGDDVDVTIS